MEDRSIEETAELTGWTRSMVKVQAWRAKKKLRKFLQAAGVEVE
jgi:DNA-directed RNA polymerase specialized sigma24 family protein